MSSESSRGISATPASRSASRRAPAIRSIGSMPRSSSLVRWVISPVPTMTGVFSGAFFMIQFEWE